MTNPTRRTAIRATLATLGAAAWTTPTAACATPAPTYATSGHTCHPTKCAPTATHRPRRKPAIRPGCHYSRIDPNPIDDRRHPDGRRIVVILWTPHNDTPRATAIAVRRK